MEVKQIYKLVNSITTETLGLEPILQEDLSNIVDLGEQIFNQGQKAVDNYVGTLVDRIGRTVLVDRIYNSTAPKVLMTEVEFGSVTQKIDAELPEAVENETWELENGTSYDPNIFYQPKVTVKYFNSKNTYEIDMSFTNQQLKESFLNATALNAFISMLQTKVENAITLKNDGLIMRVINNAIAETLAADYPSQDYSTKSTPRSINLLYEFKQEHPDSTLTAETCRLDPEFIRFVAYRTGIQIDRLAKYSTLFNVGGTAKFTPRDRLHFVMLSEFDKAASVFLQSDTYHKELTSLPNAETVAYWQGSGENYDFADTSKINVVTASGSTVELSGIIGVMFDRDALGVVNRDRRAYSYFNPKAEFYTNFTKLEAGYFNDLNENVVVFFVA